MTWFRQNNEPRWVTDRVWLGSAGDNTEVFLGVGVKLLDTFMITRMSSGQCFIAEKEF